MEPTTSKKPVKKFAYRGISASVFENVSKRDDRSVPYYKVQLQKTYKQGESYRTTSSFSREDLPVARALLQRAWEFILDAEAKRSEDSP